MGILLNHTNHLLLAKLAKVNKARNIVTTNFDKLIEQAFAAIGLQENIDFIHIQKNLNSLK